MLILGLQLLLERFLMADDLEEHNEDTSESREWGQNRHKRKQPKQKYCLRQTIFHLSFLPEPLLNAFPPTPSLGLALCKEGGTNLELGARGARAQSSILPLKTRSFSFYVATNFHCHRWPKSNTRQLGIYVGWRKSSSSIRDLGDSGSWDRCSHGSTVSISW